MEIENESMNDFAEKILAGTKLAVQRLVEASASEDKSLVVKIDGEVKRVPAKELLKRLDAE